MAKRKHRAEQPGLFQVLVPITLVIEKKVLTVMSNMPSMYIFNHITIILGHSHVLLYVLHPQTSRRAPGQLLIHRWSCVRRDTAAELHSSTAEHGRWSYRVEPDRFMQISISNVK